MPCGVAQVAQGHRLPAVRVLQRSHLSRPSSTKIAEWSPWVALAGHAGGKASSVRVVRLVIGVGGGGGGTGGLVGGKCGLLPCALIGNAESVAGPLGIWLEEPIPVLAALGTKSSCGT